MAIQSILEQDHMDHDEHLDRADHWFGVSGQTTREAYRHRMCS